MQKIGTYVYTLLIRVVFLTVSVTDVACESIPEFDLDLIST